MIFDGRISQVKSTTKLLDSTLSDNSVYIYDMMGNLQTKTGTGTAVTFGYDENGSLVSLRTDIMLDGRLGLYYFGARYLDPTLGLWTSVDPVRQFASPYLYAGNGVNPIGAIDPDGNVLKMYSRNSDAYNQRAEIAISKIENSGDAGKAFIAKLRNSEHVVTIKESSKGDFTQPTLFGRNAEVSWNPDVTRGGVNAEGDRERPNFIGLAHELGHAEDIIDGNVTTDERFNANGIPFSEENSIRRENQIREAVGEPLREEY